MNNDVYWETGDSDWSPYHFYGLNPFVSSKDNSGRKVFGPLQEKNMDIDNVRSQRRQAAAKKRSLRSKSVSLSGYRALQASYKAVRDRLLRGPPPKMRSRRKRYPTAGRSRRGRGSRRRGVKGKYIKKQGLTGGKPFVGKAGEEDAAVKRHMKYGVVYEVGYSGVSTSANGTQITHATCPEKALMVSLFMAMVKKVVNLHNGVIKNWEDLPQFPGAYSPSAVKFFLLYEKIVNGIPIKDNITVTWTQANYPTWFSLITYGETPTANLGLVELFFNEFNAFPLILQLSRFIEFQMTYTNSTAGVGETQAIAIDMDNAKFNIDLVSNFVYQNRSIPEDGSTSALDIDQQPLFEVKCYGQGSGAIRRTNISTSGVNNSSDPINMNTGLDVAVPGLGGDDRNVLAEPSKGAFINVRYVKNTICNPGVVESEKITSHYRFRLQDIVMKMKDFVNPFPTTGAIPIGKQRDMLGKFCYHWFRKTISLQNATTVSVAFQHHWAAGVTLRTHKDTSTGPFVGVVNRTIPT